MRRKDRDTTNLNSLVKILKSSDCCRIGLIDENNRAYIVPMNFGFDRKDGSDILYFHCAKDGKKIDLMKKQKFVTFEADTAHKLIIGEKTCSCSYKYCSVMGTGKIDFISNRDEKVEAFKIIMRHYTEMSDPIFSPDELDKVCVIQLKIESYTCKEHI